MKLWHLFFTHIFGIMLGFSVGATLMEQEIKAETPESKRIEWVEECANDDTHTFYSMPLPGRMLACSDAYEKIFKIGKEK